MNINEIFVHKNGTYTCIYKEYVLCVNVHCFCFKGTLMAHTIILNLKYVF